MQVHCIFRRIGMFGIPELCEVWDKVVPAINRKDCLSRKDHGYYWFVRSFKLRRAAGAEDEIAHRQPTGAMPSASPIAEAATAA